MDQTFQGTLGLINLSKMREMEDLSELINDHKGAVCLRYIVQYDTSLEITATSGMFFDTDHLSKYFPAIK